MQGQDVISRPGQRPVTHAGKSLLNPARDLPLLLLIRDATFISRQQLELLIAGRTEEVNYDCRNRRLARLVDLNQIQIYPQCFPYPGRIFAITQAGINTLQVAGMGILSVSADTETLANVGQVPHFIGLNQIEIAARKAFGIRIGRSCLGLERAMGIENTARKTIIHCNQGVTNSPDRCVRFWCEKRCRTSQRQPMRPLETNTDGAATTEQVVLNNHLLPVVNGGYGAGQARLHQTHI